jgi:hypothetical protein
MTILFLLNILLSAGAVRSADRVYIAGPVLQNPAPSATGEVTHPLKIATVSSMSGKTTVIPIEESTTIVDLKRKARNALELDPFCPSKLVCGTKVIATEGQLEETLNGTEEPQFTLVMEQTKAHSFEEIIELLLPLKECEGLVSFMAKKTVTQNNEDGTSADTEVTTPWTLYGDNVHFGTWFKYGNSNYCLPPYEPFTSKRYAFLGPRVKLGFKGEHKCDIHARVRFEITDWDFESAAEPRFKVEPVGIVFPGLVFPKPLSKTYYNKLCKNAIDQTKELQGGVPLKMLRLFDASHEERDIEYLPLKPTKADYYENLAVRLLHRLGNFITSFYFIKL